MPDIQLRPTVATDLSRLMHFHHSINSESVWQLELRRDAGQVMTTFREVHLPRSVHVTYPHDPFALADDWVRKSMMYTALIGMDLVGYICLLEHGGASVVSMTDLVVAGAYRRRGVASALLTAGQDWAASKSHRRMILRCRQKSACHPSRPKV